MNSYLVFASIWFLAAAAPGADTMLLISTTLTSGWKSAVGTSVGISTAKILLLLVSYFGLAGLLAAAPQTFVILKILGCAFLLWRAYRLFTSTPANQSTARSSGGKNFALAFTVAVSNPQAMLFYVAVMPTITSSTNPVVLAVIIGVGFSLISAFYICLATPIRKWISRGKNQMIANRVIAGFFVILTVVIALR
jgi:threonine/homoserine/homoserine lactone efflux protein